MNPFIDSYCYSQPSAAFKALVLSGLQSARHTWIYNSWRLKPFKGAAQSLGLDRNWGSFMSTLQLPSGDLR